MFGLFVHFLSPPELGMTLSDRYLPWKRLLGFIFLFFFFLFVPELGVSDFP